MEYNWADENGGGRKCRIKIYTGFFTHILHQIFFLTLN